MADQEESVDSRTSMVGRKRARDDSVELGNVSGDGTSADEAFVSRKRARQNENTDIVPSSLNVASDIGTQIGSPSFVPEVRALGWNKGVQSGGIRTSFGSKQSKYTIQPSFEDEEVQLGDGSAVVKSHLEREDAKQESKAPQDLFTSTVEATSIPYTSNGEFSSAEQPASTLRDIGMNGVEQESGKTEASSKFLISNPPTEVILNHPNPESQAAINISRPEPPVLQAASRVYENYVDAKKGKTPVCVPRPTPPAFEFRGNDGVPGSNGPRAAQQIPVHVGPKKQAQPVLTRKEKRAAAAASATPATTTTAVAENSQMFTRAEIESAVKAACAAQKWSAHKIAKLLVGDVPGIFTKKQLSAYNTLSKDKKNLLPAVHRRNFERGTAERKSRGSGNNSGRTSQKEASSHAAGSITIDDEQDAVTIVEEHEDEDSDSYDPETALDSSAIASTSGSQWNPVNAPAPPTLDEILENLNETELLLQLKYFPTADGRLYTPRCLFCAQIGHATYDCPATSCTSCGENSDHSTMSCPKTQRCGKCREQGHSTSKCPSKLFRSKSEVVPCDLCGSSAHIESGCHMIWRSFFPKPEEIKTVRTFPVDCYTCGKEGHLGPECGLYQGPGNMTWSRTNFSRYVNDSSTSQVNSAGVDYTIKSKSKKTFTIKGKANDPINLDSDDEEGFIHTKINTATAPKGQIQFGNLQPPSGPRGNTSRSSFAGDSYAPVQPARNQGARYERERTFSPPPRFDRYPPPAQFQRPGGERSGGGLYQERERPPKQQPNLNANKLPRKPKNSNKKAKARKAQQGGH